MELARHAPQRFNAAAITTAILVPVVALAPACCAAAPGLPASAKPAHSVTAYVANSRGYTVVGVNTPPPWPRRPEPRSSPGDIHSVKANVQAYLASWTARGFSPVTIENDSGVL